MTTERDERWDCGTVRELLPLVVGESLPAGERRGVDRHLAACTGCRREADLVRMVRGARPEAPSDLSEAVLRRLGTDGAPDRVGRGEVRRPRLRRIPAWGVAAAAGVVLALGVGLIWQAAEAPDPMWTLALEAPMDAWTDEDWVVAGEPLFEGMSEDMLASLLEEMEP